MARSSTLARAASGGRSTNRRNTPGADLARGATSRPDHVDGVRSQAGRNGQFSTIELPKLRLPPVVRRRSRVHGWGVFAVEAIAKNTRIIAYTGERITHRESLRRERRYLRDGNIWCFRLNRRWVVDGAVGGSDARFINHACRPNCYTQIIDGIIWIRASRNIAAGEELTYNYYTEGAGSIRCRCRPGCATML